MDQNYSKKNLKRRIEVLGLMESLTRLRIILSLLMFKKVSLTKLSKLLGRAKSTITHHMEILDNLGLITSTRKDARGSIDAKVYELSPKFLEKLYLETDKITLFKLSKDRDVLNDIMLSDMLFFKIIKILFDQAILYYDGIISKDMKVKPNIFKDFQDKHFKNQINYDFWLLSEKGREIYEDRIKKIKKELDNITHQENLESKEVVRPYLVLNTFFPLLQMIEYDSELKEFRKFFQTLE